MWRRNLKPRDVRDLTLFITGLAGVFHETVIATAERPTLLLLFAACLGLPAFLRTDEKHNGGSEKKNGKGGE